MKEVTLKLNIDEINVILASLGNMSYIQVHQLITKIQTQAEPQVESNGAEKVTVAGAKLK